MKKNLPFPSYSLVCKKLNQWLLVFNLALLLLFQPLARLGATVVGVDMVEENIRVAQTHLMEDPIIVERVKYIHGAVEDLVMTKEGRFDAVVASEVVEHVSDIDMFISSCCKLLKVCYCTYVTNNKSCDVQWNLY